MPERSPQEISTPATQAVGPPLQQAAGVSLTTDALRKLRKNRAAMASVAVLVSVVLLAFLTPLLPLTPPDRLNTDLKFAEPTLEDAWRPTFNYKPDAMAQSYELAAKARAREVEKRAAYRELKGSAASEEEAAALMRAYQQASNAAEDRIQRPYSDLGFPKLDPLARLMVRMRYAVFGQQTIGPVCGRDKLGRDLLSRIFWGSRVSLIVGFVATLVSLVIGVSWGAVAGFTGGWVDNLMMRIVDVLYSLPFIFIVIFIITLLSGEEMKQWLDEHGIDRITIFYFVVGAIYWLTMSRVVRGQVLSIKNELYVEAARALGARRPIIILRHVVPNLLSVVIVYLTLTIPQVILFETFLSFLGLGVEPPDVSWGLLANEGIEVISPVKTYWWLIVFPSLAMGATLLALNFLGDGLRDAFDPKLRAG
ncbi:Dipeptide transport system permease protein DppC [Pirellulimonas nuda]|uniref:Oligopeptide transport system permease protein OppC n=1 Tax=Pirellulimonas nuda TaxID=2528009 RepID=A0A518DIG9_9BACT|nr:ABC transporter permease [Pirellulimonas nuda]QDU91202.1 Dipeptide transport system permease protein DppC [Pirellulimonas nuda]